MALALTCADENVCKCHWQDEHRALCFLPDPEEEEEEEERRLCCPGAEEMGIFQKAEAGSFVRAGISPAGGDIKTALCTQQERCPKQSKKRRKFLAIPATETFKKEARKKTANTKAVIFLAAP